MAAKIMWHHQMKLKEKSKFENVRAWLKSAVSLMIIMGLTWTCGLLVVTESSLSFLAYLFTILMAFQGLFIFLIFVVFSKTVREAYIKWWRVKVNESSFLSRHFGELTIPKLSQSSSKHKEAKGNNEKKGFSDKRLTAVTQQQVSNLYQTLPSQSSSAPYSVTYPNPIADSHASDSCYLKQKPLHSSESSEPDLIMTTHTHFSKDTPLSIEKSEPDSLELKQGHTPYSSESSTRDQSHTKEDDLQLENASLPPDTYVDATLTSDKKSNSLESLDDNVKIQLDEDSEENNYQSFSIHFV